MFIQFFIAFKLSLADNRFHSASIYLSTFISRLVIRLEHKILKMPAKLLITYFLSKVETTDIVESQSQH